MDIFIQLLPSILVVIGGALAFWKTWGAISERINGVGGRVTELELGRAANVEAINQLKNFQSTSILTHAAIQERVGKIEKSVEHTDDLINKMRIEIIEKINALQRDIATNQGKVRERVVRLEVITQIENKLGRNLDELLGSVE